MLFDREKVRYDQFNVRLNSYEKELFDKAYVEYCQFIEDISQSEFFRRAVKEFIVKNNEFIRRKIYECS